MGTSIGDPANHTRTKRSSLPCYDRDGGGDISEAYGTTPSLWLMSINCCCCLRMDFVAPPFCFFSHYLRRGNAATDRVSIVGNKLKACMYVSQVRIMGGMERQTGEWWGSFDTCSMILGTFLLPCYLCRHDPPPSTKILIKPHTVFDLARSSLITASLSIIKHASATPASSCCGFFIQRRMTHDRRIIQRHIILSLLPRQRKLYDL